MGALRGVIVGTLLLSAGEALVSSKQGASSVGVATGLVTKAINHLVDPSVPMIPDLTGQTPHVEAN